MPIKIFATIPLLALFAACVPVRNDRVDTTTEIEQTTDQDIDGDGTIRQGGVPVGTRG